MGVADRFSKFLGNIALTEEQKTKGLERRDAVVRSLNANYYGTTSATNHSTLVGSWGKFTRIRPPRDVDVLFTLPYATYERFQQRTGNRQSQLLQEVRTLLLSAYPNTAIRGDGPVVLVPFSAFNVEVIPAFAAQDGGHLVCMTDGGGSYKRADYDAEMKIVSDSNSTTNGNTRDLVRMMKTWQGYCSVPLKSFHLELLATTFLAQWEYSGKSKTYYDWMVRDFLSFLVSRANWNVYAPGTGETMSLGNAWETRAKSALERAKKACDYESSSSWTLAGEEWQKIFGPDIPKAA